MGGKKGLKAVALLSGGMDSTVLAYLLHDQGYDLHLLSFNYGQRHSRETDFAALTAQKLHAKWDLIDLRSMSSLIGTSALTNAAIPVPEGHYSAETMKITVVPNRNAIMLAIAYGVAVSEGATLVGTAVHAGDHQIYADCRSEFITALAKAFKLGNEGFAEPGLFIFTPFITSSKTDIAHIGKQLSVPFEDTWSCYRGGPIACGRCSTDIERLEALNEARVIDLTPYEDGDFWKTVVKEYKESVTA